MLQVGARPPALNFTVLAVSASERASDLRAVLAKSSTSSSSKPKAKYLYSCGSSPTALSTAAPSGRTSESDSCGSGRESRSSESGDESSPCRRPAPVVQEPPQRVAAALLPVAAQPAQAPRRPRSPRLQPQPQKTQCHAVCGSPPPSPSADAPQDLADLADAVSQYQSCVGVLLETYERSMPSPLRAGVLLEHAGLQPSRSAQRDRFLISAAARPGSSPSQNPFRGQAAEQPQKQTSKSSAAPPPSPKGDVVITARSCLPPTARAVPKPRWMGGEDVDMLVATPKSVRFMTHDPPAPTRGFRSDCSVGPPLKLGELEEDALCCLPPALVAKQLARTSTDAPKAPAESGAGRHSGGINSGPFGLLVPSSSATHKEKPATASHAVAAGNSRDVGDGFVAAARLVKSSQSGEPSSRGHADSTTDEGGGSSSDCSSIPGSRFGTLRSPDPCGNFADFASLQSTAQVCPAAGTAAWSNHMKQVQTAHAHSGGRTPRYGRPQRVLAHGDGDGIAIPSIPLMPCELQEPVTSSCAMAAPDGSTGGSSDCSSESGDSFTEWRASLGLPAPIERPRSHDGFITWRESLQDRLGSEPPPTVRTMDGFNTWRRGLLKEGA